MLRELIILFIIAAAFTSFCQGTPEYRRIIAALPTGFSFDSKWILLRPTMKWHVTKEYLQKVPPRLLMNTVASQIRYCYIDLMRSRSSLRLMELPAAERNVVLLDNLIAEVNNGGVSQYIDNCAWQVPLARQVLIDMGETSAAKGLKLDYEARLRKDEDHGTCMHLDMDELDRKVCAYILSQPPEMFSELDEELERDLCAVYARKSEPRLASENSNVAMESFANDTREIHRKLYEKYSTCGGCN